jgi:prevent-host-death family protein
MGSNWTLKDAETEFVTIAEAAKAGDPQRVTMPGDGAVVVVSAADYDRLSKRPKTLVEHILDFPKLPDDCQDLFDKTEPLLMDIREIDFDE